MPNTKPFVAVACIAESVIIEKNDIPSVIRIVDTFTVRLPANLPTNLKPAHVLDAYIALKSGDIKGTFNLECVIRPPSGKDRLIGSWPVVFEGGIHGVNLNLKISIQGIEFDSPYWLDVLWGTEKELLTSIPFRFKQTVEEQGLVEANTNETKSDD